MDLHALFSVQHPAVESVGARKAIDEWTKPDALYHSPHSNRTRTRHTYSKSTMQLCPCQPTCTTLPSSTNSGTLRWPAANARMRQRATTSASTSYSTNSERFHSNHSRISLVWGQRAVP